MLDGRRQSLEQAQGLLVSRRAPTCPAAPRETQVYRRSDGRVGMVSEAAIRVLGQLATTFAVAGCVERVEAAKVQVWQVDRDEVLRVGHLLIELDGSLPVRRGIRITEQAVGGLGRAHSCGQFFGGPAGRGPCPATSAANVSSPAVCSAWARRSCNAIFSLGSRSAATASASRACRGRCSPPVASASRRVAVNSRSPLRTSSASRPLTAPIRSSPSGRPATASVDSTVRA